MGAACRDETEALDDRAEDIVDQRDDLAEAQEDVNEERGDLAKEASEVAHASADLANAEADFAGNRELYVDALRDRQSIFESQAAIAASMIGDLGMTEGDRAEAASRLLNFERELTECEGAIDGLATATAAQWDAATETTGNAFEQLSDAHDELFDVLTAERKLTRDVDVTPSGNR
jgi:hypothetical protein